MEKENVATAEAITTEASAKINNYSEIPQEERDFVHAGSIFQNDNDSIIAQKLWDFSQSCSDCYHLPQGMIEAVMIAVASTAIGTKIHVTSGVHDTNVSTWMCLVAPSGAGKTPLLNEIMSPLKSIQAQRYEEFKVFFVFLQHDYGKTLHTNIRLPYF